MEDQDILKEFMQKIQIDDCVVEITVDYRKGYREDSIDALYEYVNKGKAESAHVGFLEGIGVDKQPKKGKRSGNANIKSKCLVTFDFDLKENMKDLPYRILDQEMKLKMCGGFYEHFKNASENIFGTPLMVNFTGNGFHIHYYIKPIEYDKEIWRKAYEAMRQELKKLCGIEFDSAFATGSQIKRIPLSWNVKKEPFIKGLCFQFSKDADSSNNLMSFFVDAQASIEHIKEEATKKFLAKTGKSEDYASEVKAALTMRSICCHFGYEYNPKSKVMRSPLRDDKNASMSFNDDKKVWLDFGSGDSGDYFEFIKKALVTDSFYDALMTAKEITGIEPPKKDLKQADAPKFDVFKSEFRSHIEDKDYFMAGQMLNDAFDNFWWQNAYDFDNWHDFQESLGTDRKNQRRYLAYYRIVNYLNTQDTKLDMPSHTVCEHLDKLRKPGKTKKKGPLDYELIEEVWRDCIKNKQTSARKVQQAVKEKLDSRKQLRRRSYRPKL